MISARAFPALCICNVEVIMEMKSKIRKWLAIVITAVSYFIVHEGAHLLVALLLGIFEKMRFMGIGMQIVIDTSKITDIQLAVFNVAGSVATLLVAYFLVLMTRTILLSQNKFFGVVCYYLTLGFLVVDPLYLSVLCGFFGGGDMNGIILFGISEIAARSIYSAIGIINLYVFIKIIFPAYKKKFQCVKIATNEE